MKFMKRTLAVVLSVALMMGGSATAMAEAGLIDTSANTETTIIDTTNSPETSLIDTGAAETETQLPESGVDLSDTDFSATDLTGYVEWDGKTPFRKGENYYIKGSAKIKGSFYLPAESQLVVCNGAELLMYTSGKLDIKGSLLIEQQAKVTVSGTMNVYKESSVDCYGEFAASKSSTINILSEFVIRHDAKATYSGKVNIYNDGVYLNYGKSVFTKNSVTMLTGELQTPESGSMLCKGYLGITISGRTTQAGYLYLSGELVNSGVFIFEKDAHYFKSKAARFAVSKSSRLIDYRQGKGTYSGNISATTDKGIKGIDVSYAQGAVDWAEVRFSGIQFAMMRASRGDISASKPMAPDAVFEYNITEALKNGIDVGVYHYLYASTVEEAVEEARFFIKTISPYKITYPVVLDVEEQYQADLGKEEITRICKAFLDEVKAAGYYPMIYANKQWLTNYLDMSQLSEYDVWLAQWNTVPTYNGEFGMWQYSNKGIVSGIDGYVDLNLSYKRYPLVIKEAGLNHLT